MYSKFDDPEYRPLPGELERDRIKTLELRRLRRLREVAEIEAEIERLKSLPYVLDIPLPLV